MSREAVGTGWPRAVRRPEAVRRSREAVTWLLPRRGYNCAINFRWTTAPRRRRATAIGIATALACAVALAACGSSGKPGAASASSLKSAGIRFSECMRSHGVPNFPDPGGGSGGGIKIPLNSGLDPRSPAFQTAQAACQKLLPFGGPGRGGNSEQRKEMLVKLARCMRAHGITSFPDPTNGRPTLPPTGGGIAFGGPGGFISVPRSMLRSPGFMQAAAACDFPGFGRGAKGQAGPVGG